MAIPDDVAPPAGELCVCLAGNDGPVDLGRELAPSCRGILVTNDGGPTSTIGLAWSAIPRVYAAAKRTLRGRSSSAAMPGYADPSPLAARAAAAMAVVNPFCITAWNVRKEVVAATVAALSTGSGAMPAPVAGCRCPLCYLPPVSCKAPSARLFLVLAGEARLVDVALSMHTKAAEAWAHRRWLLAVACSVAATAAAAGDSSVWTLLAAFLDGEVRAAELGASRRARHYHAWLHRLQVFRARVWAARLRSVLAASGGAGNCERADADAATAAAPAAAAPPTRALVEEEETGSDGAAAAVVDALLWGRPIGQASPPAPLADVAAPMQAYLQAGDPAAALPSSSSGSGVPSSSWPPAAAAALCHELEDTEAVARVVPADHCVWHHRLACLTLVHAEAAGPASLPPLALAQVMGTHALGPGQLRGAAIAAATVAAAAAPRLATTVRSLMRRELAVLDSLPASELAMLGPSSSLLLPPPGEGGEGAASVSAASLTRTATPLVRGCGCCAVPPGSAMQAGAGGSDERGGGVPQRSCPLCCARRRAGAVAARDAPGGLSVAYHRMAVEAALAACD